MSWKRGLPKCQPLVLSRLATGKCKQLQPRGSTGIPQQAQDGWDHTGLTDGDGEDGLA